MSIWSVANQRSVMWGEKGHVIKMGQSEGWSFTCHSSAILYTAHSFLPKVFDTSQTVMFKMKKKIILLLMIVVCLANHVPLIGTQRADMKESFRFWFSYLLVPGWCSVAVGHRRPVYSLVFFFFNNNGLLTVRCLDNSNDNIYWQSRNWTLYCCRRLWVCLSKHSAYFRT